MGLYNMGRYIRRGRKYNIEEILPLICENKKIDLDGDLINFDSSRLHTFKKNGTVCSCCGIKGVYFVKEKNRKHKDTYNFHLNLYALDKNGNEVLMTSDHIIPQSICKGLKNNRQTMCLRCNQIKGNREIDNKDLARELGYEID